MRREGCIKRHAIALLMEELYIGKFFHKNSLGEGTTNCFRPFGIASAVVPLVEAIQMTNSRLGQDCLVQKRDVRIPINLICLTLLGHLDLALL